MSTTLAMNLVKLSSILAESPDLASALDYDTLVNFVDLVGILKPTLTLLQPLQDTDPLEHLPINVHDFLKASLHLGDETVKLAWKCLARLAWSTQSGTSDEDFVRRAGSQYLQMFLDHGLCRGIGAPGDLTINLFMLICHNSILQPLPSNPCLS